MIPTVFTSSFHYFQGPRRVYSAAVVGTIASIAPTLGPVIGGWITDTLNWHWLFYVNLLPGVGDHAAHPVAGRYRQARSAASQRGGLSRHRPDGRQSRHARIRAGRRHALELVRRCDDQTCAYIAGVSGVLFIARSLTFARPVVDLRALDKPQFRGRMFSVVHHRHRHLFHDLSHPAVSRLCARFQRLADRPRDLLDRRGLAHRRAHLHLSGPQVRHALADDARARLVRPRDVELSASSPTTGARTNCLSRKFCAVSRRSSPSRPASISASAACRRSGSNMPAACST